MNRLKTFAKYALIIIAFWIVSDLLIFVAVNGSYKYKNCEIATAKPKITVYDCKATYINGYVKGNILNNTDSLILTKYIKIDCYSQRDVKLGSKYIEINNLKPNESRNFEIYYKYTGVDYCRINVVDDAKEVSDEEFLSEEMKTSMIIGTLLVLFFI